MVGGSNPSPPAFRRATASRENGPKIRTLPVAHSERSERARLASVRIPRRPLSATNEREERQQYEGFRTRRVTAREASAASDPECLHSVRIPRRPCNERTRGVTSPQTGQLSTPSHGEYQTD